MSAVFKNKPLLFFCCTLFIYALLGLINLQTLPIAWTDEVMNLDPALQWHKHGSYSGLLWPNAGSDIIFLSYPPLIELFHIGILYVLPLDMFWMRLPFFLLHLGTLLLLFHLVLGISRGNYFLAAALSVLFMFDKVVFEISRSMRVEVLETFLIALLFFMYQRRSANWARGLVLGLLVLAHLKMWPLVLLWIAFETWQNKRIRHAFMLILFSALPFILFSVFIDFQYRELYGQMFVQASKHGASGNIFQNAFAWMFGRFWPVYKEQPWAVVIALAMLFLSLYRLWTKRGKDLTALIFAGTSLAWAMILAPHYRYWPPLFFIGTLLLANTTQIQNLFLKKGIKTAAVLFLFLMIPGFVARHALALYQREERQPEMALNWLHATIDQSKKTLIIGEGIAFYFSKHKNIDYGMVMYPQNLHFGNYEKVFYLTRDSVALPVASEYTVKKKEVFSGIRQFVRGETYAGLKLCEIKDQQQWDLVTGAYRNDY